VTTFYLNIKFENGGKIFSFAANLWYSNKCVNENPYRDSHAHFDRREKFFYWPKISQSSATADFFEMTVYWLIRVLAQPLRFVWKRHAARKRIPGKPQGLLWFYPLVDMT
jgi:hypothetical protein